MLGVAGMGYPGACGQTGTDRGELPVHRSQGMRANPAMRWGDTTGPASHAEICWMSAP